MCDVRIYYNTQEYKKYIKIWFVSILKYKQRF